MNDGGFINYKTSVTYYCFSLSKLGRYSMKLLFQLFDKIQKMMMIIMKNVHFKYYGDFNPFTALKMKFSTKDFFSKCDFDCDLIAFTGEINNGKLHFLCSV